MYKTKEWLEAMTRSQIRAATWIYCPGHAGVRGNEVADGLAGQATVGAQITVDKSDLLKQLQRALREEETDCREYYGIERMKESGVLLGEGRTSRLYGKARRIHNQTTTGTVIIYTLRAILMRGTEHLWVCPECCDVAPSDK